MSHPQSNVTELLLDWNRGNEEALDELMPLVYAELHRLAASYLKRERRGHTLQATALVNEAYMLLVDQTRVEWQNRAHFLGIAARLMRRILVDHARRRRADKRGGGARRVTLDETLLADGEGHDLDLVALDGALRELAETDERLGRLVELRYFGGLTIDETAEVLEVSPATVKRDWVTARAWLYRALRGESP